MDTTTIYSLPRDVMFLILRDVCWAHPSYLLAARAVSHAWRAHCDASGVKTISGVEKVHEMLSNCIYRHQWSLFKYLYKTLNYSFTVAKNTMTLSQTELMNECIREDKHDIIFDIAIKSRYGVELYNVIRYAPCSGVVWNAFFSSMVALNGDYDNTLHYAWHDREKMRLFMSLGDFVLPTVAHSDWRHVRSVIQRYVTEEPLDIQKHVIENLVYFFDPSRAFWKSLQSCDFMTFDFLLFVVQTCRFATKETCALFTKWQHHAVIERYCHKCAYKRNKRPLLTRVTKKLKL
jgi:hypothetical protein